MFFLVSGRIFRVMQTFEELFQSLNPAQQKAVQTIEGPVMVIAGPGTGKTQILAARILNILKQSDTRPENILCLTYTEAGATAMRQRLSAFMGTDSYRVNIHTFHSLCNRLISERPDLYSRRELRVIDDLEKVEIFQSIMESLPHDSVIKDYESYNTHLNWQLNQTWNAMRELQLTSEEIESYNQKLKDPEFFKACFPKAVYSRATKTAKAGDIKEKEYNLLFSSWEKLLAAVHLYPEYKAQKAALGVYEFSDMIDWVHEKLSTDEDYKMSVQERFQFVLVDEFQDTSYQQGDILRLLTDYWGDQANCFVVGDDDQSIYAFQGARIGNMLEFKQRYYNTLQTIVLTENYRSSQAILDASSSLIRNNTLRLTNTEVGLSKELVSSGANRNFDPLEPQIHAYTNEFHEILGVTQDIETLIQNGTAPQDIAILYPKHRFADDFIALFRERNIPFVLNRKINILNEPIVDLLLNWLEYLNRELQEPNSGEYLLYPLLASNLYQFRPIALNQLSTDIQEHRIQKRKEAVYSGYSWREHLHEIKKGKIATPYLEEKEKSALVTLFDFIEKWIKNTASTNVGDLVAQVFSEFGFLALATQNPDSHWLLEVLHTFTSHVNQQCERFPFIKLNELLNQIETLRAASIEISLEKRIGNNKGIQLYTAHSSKGLEFDHVFIIRALEKEWGDASATQYPFKMRELLEAFRGQIENSEELSQAMEERRRLFFVAITRAKKSVHISYFTQKLTENKDSLTPSQFIGEVNPEYFQSNPKARALYEQDLIWAQHQILLRKGKPILEVSAEDWLDERIQRFTFSPSSIQSILKCGVTFYFNYIVRVPSSPSEYLSYGNAMHACMRYLVDIQREENRWLTVEEWKQYFDFQMNRMKGSFTEKQFESRLEQGRSILGILLESKKEDYAKYSNTKTEYSIQTEIDGVLLKGNIDKLIIDGSRAIISDYKTGKVKKIREKSRLSIRFKPGDIPSDYWLQVGIYVMMVNANKELGLFCDMGAIESLTENEEGRFETIEMYYNAEHTNILKELIREAQDRLEKRDFLNGCGKDGCVWCAFTKQQGWVKYLPTDESL